MYYTNKRTDAWWDIFMIWKIDFWLLAVAWAGLWEKRFGPIMSNFWGRFFQLFVVKKKILKIFWKHCSVRTEKLHRKKVKKNIIFLEEFFFSEKPVFFRAKIWVEFECKYMKVGTRHLFSYLCFISYSKVKWIEWIYLRKGKWKFFYIYGQENLRSYSKSTMQSRTKNLYSLNLFIGNTAKAVYISS